MEVAPSDHKGSVGRSRRERVRGLRAACPLVLLLLLVAGCDSAVPRIEAVEEQGRTFAVLDYLTLAVETTNGTVRVWGVDGLEEVRATAFLRAWGGTQKQAQERLEQLTVEMSQDGDRVQLRFRSGPYRGWGRSPQVDFDVAVPTHADVSVIVENGSIGVADLTGTLSADTENGGIDAVDIRGDAALTADNGSIDIDRARAHLKLATDNGAITVLQSRCSLNAEADNGDVRFSGQLVGPQHRMKSDNGTLIAEIPADSELAIEARVDSGSISTTLPLVGDTQGRQWSAVLNAPTSTLTLRTGNGSIDIRELAGT